MHTSRPGTSSARPDHDAMGATPRQGSRCVFDPDSGTLVLEIGPVDVLDRQGGRSGGIDPALAGDPLIGAQPEPVVLEFAGFDPGTGEYIFTGGSFSVADAGSVVLIDGQVREMRIGRTVPGPTLGNFAWFTSLSVNEGEDADGRSSGWARGFVETGLFGHGLSAIQRARLVFPVLTFTTEIDLVAATNGFTRPADLPATVLLTIATDPQAGPATWFDTFDGYPVGPLAGLGGWEPWGGDPALAGFRVSGERSFSPPNAVEIDGEDDAVRRLEGYERGTWEIRARQYVPSSLTGRQAFILLNTYPATRAAHWSLQLVADGAAGTFGDYDTGAAVPLATDRWAEIRVVVDLERDEQSVYYDGQWLLTRSWTAGVVPGGARNVAAVDLFGFDSAGAVWYDDLEIAPAQPVGACTVERFGCTRVGAEACEAFEGTYGGDGSECPEPPPFCAADCDGDGRAAVGDFFCFVQAYAAGCP